MLKQILLTLLIFGSTAVTFKVSAVHSSSTLKTMDAMAMAPTMTVNDFLAIDIKEYRTAEGKKMKWTHRLILGGKQKNLAKKVRKGEIEGTATMSMAAAPGQNNTLGLLSVIFSIVGLFIPYLGLPMIIAALVLGILGLKRDYNPTLATIGTVLSSVFLVIVIIALIGGYWS
jgi:hypothetical protein